MKLALFLLLTSLALAQTPTGVKNKGIVLAGDYDYQPIKVYQGNSATGSQSIKLVTGTITLPDGRTISPFATNVPITIGGGAEQETVTPSAVSNCGLAQPIGSCTITATFSQIHSTASLVKSGDNGLQEALNDAASLHAVVIDENGNIASANTWTGAQTFTGPTNLLGPVFNVKSYGAKGDARSIIDGVTSNGSTTVTSATANWSSADVGKIFWCNNVNGLLSTGVGSQPSTSVATIVSVQSSTSITITPAANANAGSGQYCVWGTQDDTSDILAASNAAEAATEAIPQQGASTARAGTVYVPGGGYIVSGNIASFVYSSRYTAAPNFIGEGRGQTVFYVMPTFNLQTAPMLDYENAADFKVGGFSIWGARAVLKGWATAAIGLISLGNGTAGHYSDRWILSSVEADDIGFNGSNNSILFAQARNSSINDVFIQQSWGSDVSIALYINQSDGIVVNNPSLSNHNQNLFVVGAGPRDGTHAQVVINGGFIDECGNAGSVGCAVVNQAGANFIGTTLWGNTVDWPLEVKSASTVWLTDVDAGTYIADASGTGVTVDSGGTLYASGSTFKNVGTGTAISNSGTFFDMGGNQYLRCVQNSTCSAATATQAFGGTAPYGVASPAPPFSTLSACSSSFEGQTASISDSNTVTFNATAAGAGTNHVKVMCNGTSWVVY